MFLARISLTPIFPHEHQRAFFALNTITSTALSSSFVPIGQRVRLSSAERRNGVKRSQTSCKWQSYIAAKKRVHKEGVLIHRLFLPLLHHRLVPPASCLPLWTLQALPHLHRSTRAFKQVTITIASWRVIRWIRLPHRVSTLMSTPQLLVYRPISVVSVMLLLEHLDHG